MICFLLPLASLSAQPLAILEDEPGGPVYLGGQILIKFKPSATDAELLGAVRSGALNLIKHIHTDAMKARGDVGVIDEGMQWTHSDLAANVDYADSRNFIDSPITQNIYTSGQDSHGTHVAGTIGAVGNNTLGVVGVNWNVQIISGKFLGPSGGTTADAIEAVDYFTNLKSTRPEFNLVALNNTWGGGGFSQALLDAIVRAAQQNILFVAAAGNGDWRGIAVNTDVTPFYPSCYDTTSKAGYNSVISVTAVSRSQINLAWTDNANNETGFKIERSTNNRTFTQIATVGANVTTYSNTGLSRNTTYYYRVRAYNAAGNSAYSNTASAKTPRN